VKRVQHTFVIVLAIFLPALVACGSSSKPTSSPTNPTTTTAAAACSPAPTKPTVTVPPGLPPTKLVVKDLKPGTGAAAQAGHTVTVHYVGVHYTTGKQFDASWDRGQPFSFPLGAGQVIPGWDQGLVGMKVCGRRELIIPPALAYGNMPPAGGDIQPGETLVFVVDLLSVQ
jgi:peptidylprolyl isomerase